jgi:hypothetical protein
MTGVRRGARRGYGATTLALCREEEYGGTKMQPHTTRMTARLSLGVLLVAVAVGTAAAREKDGPALEKRAYALHEGGRHDEALAVVEELVRLVEGNRSYGKEVRVKAHCFLLAYAALFARQPEKALAAAHRGLVLAPQQLLCHKSRAHALLFLGRTSEAQRIYVAHKGEPVGNVSWEAFIAADFKELRANGLDHSRMADVERAVAEAPASPQARSQRNRERSSRDVARRVRDACLAAHLECVTDCNILDAMGRDPLIEKPGECAASCDHQKVMCLRTYAR